MQKLYMQYLFTYASCQMQCGLCLNGRNKKLLLMYMYVERMYALHLEVCLMCMHRRYVRFQNVREIDK